MDSIPVNHSESNIDAKKHFVSEVLTRLDSIWTPGDWVPSGKPVDELVGTILSQNTSDTNTERAFASLKQAFASWHEVIAASVDEVVEAIREGGLAVQKAPRIQRALREVVGPDVEDPNRELLFKLDRMEPPDAMQWLTSMEGVGPKTAACVLLFAVGKPVIPVDTHVHRVSGRLGLVEEKVSADRAHLDLLQVVPEVDAYRFHVHLIHHGRTICKARSPQCPECVLLDLCPYGSAVMSNA